MIQLYDYVKPDGSRANLLTGTGEPVTDLRIVTPAGSLSMAGLLSNTQSPSWLGLQDYANDKLKVHPADTVQHHLDNIAKLAVAEADFSFATRKFGLRITRTPNVTTSGLRSLAAYVDITSADVVDEAITEMSTVIFDGMTDFGFTFSASQIQPPPRVPGPTAPCLFLPGFSETMFSAECNSAMLAIGKRALLHFVEKLAALSGRSIGGNHFFYVTGGKPNPGNVKDGMVDDDVAYRQLEPGIYLGSEVSNLSDVTTTIDLIGYDRLNSLSIVVPRLFADVANIVINPMGSSSTGFFINGLDNMAGQPIPYRGSAFTASVGTISRANEGRSWGAAGGKRLNSQDAAVFPVAVPNGDIRNACGKPVWLSALDASVVPVRPGAARQMYIMPYELTSVWLEDFSVTLTAPSGIQLNSSDIRASIPVAAVRAYLIRMRDGNGTTTKQKADISAQLEKSAASAETVLKVSISGDSLAMPKEIVKSLELYDKASDADVDVYGMQLAEGVTFKTAQNRIGALDPQRVWIYGHDDGAIALSGLLSPEAQIIADRMENKSLKTVVTIAAHVQDITGLVVTRAYVNDQQSGVLLDSDDCIYLLSMGATVIAAAETIVGYTEGSETQTLSHLGLTASYKADLLAKIAGRGLSGPSWAQLAPHAFTDVHGYPVIHKTADLDKRYRGILVYKGVNTTDLERFCESCIFFNDGLVEAINASAAA